jgi:hypothetical protein
LQTGHVLAQPLVDAIGMEAVGARQHLHLIPFDKVLLYQYGPYTWLYGPVFSSPFIKDLWWQKAIGLILFGRVH